MTNPLFFETNQIIEFGKIEAHHFQEASTIFLEKAQQKLHYIQKNIPNEALLNDYDELMNPLRILHGLAYWLNSVSTDQNLRQSCTESIEKLDAFMNALSLDEGLFKAFQEFDKTAYAYGLTASEQKFLDDTIKEFTKNGLHLPAKTRQRIKEIKDQLSVLSITFSQNIAQHQDHLFISEQDTKGLPEDYKAARKTPEGTYKIGLDYPSYIPFMQLADSEQVRKDLYIKYLNKAADKNLTILENIVALRTELANLIGFSSYAAYVQSTMMAQKPENVWDLENDLKERVQQKAQKDYQELLEIKNQYIQSDKINSWESAYYNHLLMKNKYSVDSQEVKQYFELNNVIDGVFKICKILYNIEFEEVKNVKLWHETAQFFEIKENGKLIGRFYLDLFPRENKYGHAACFPIISGKKTENAYQIPLLALVCNFPKPTAEKPALLSHSDVETYFHEFGHALHGILAQANLGLQSGFNTTTDFVEVPSQHFENWCWDYDSLKLFAKHYKTGEILPKTLFDKMLAAKKVGSGLFYQRQILFGTFDMCLHDNKMQGSIMETYKKLSAQISLYDFVENTCFPASFGHLTDYGALYYSYLWSLVYAEDVFSIFRKEGVLNSQVGQKYKNSILSKGGSVSEMQQLEDFLGRKPQKEAFLASLGV